LIDRKVQYLLALVKEEHFARAASACNVSQPALSAGIQQLELELGVPIVKRGQRFHGLTPEGEIVLTWARQALADSEKLQEELRRATGNFSGTLRIGVVNFATPLATILLLPFEEQWPQINIRMFTRNAYDLQQYIEDFAIDVAITYLEPKQKRHGHFHTFYTEEYALLIHRSHPLSRRDSVTWDEVRDLPLCLLAPEMQVLGTEESKILTDKSSVAQVIMNSVLAVTDHVKTGRWMSVLPRPIHVMIANDPELRAIPLPAVGEPPQLGIIVPDREPPSHMAAEFFKLATSKEVVRQIERAVHPPEGRIRKKTRVV
jgi:DNA-binding transcriptional LysR family regulator